jgi:O-antigen ligase
MEAHNLYLQELTRFGIVGLVVQYLPLLLGLGLAVVAAWRGRAWPLAILVSFGVASLTEVFMDGWLMVSAYVLLLVLAVAATRGPDAGAAPPSALSSKRADDVAIGP